MSAPRLKIDQVIDSDPCGDYSLGRLRELAAGRRGLTPKDVMALPIPIDDRAWCLGVDGYIQPARLLRLIAARFARLLLREETKASRRPRLQSWVAVRMAEQYAQGRAERHEVVEAARRACFGAPIGRQGFLAWDAAVACCVNAHEYKALRQVSAWVDEYYVRSLPLAVNRRVVAIVRRVLEPEGLWA